MTRVHRPTPGLDPRTATPEDWAGAVHGHVGTLAQRDGKAECHICGRHFGNLGAHVSRTHEMDPDMYRAFFGLKATTGLLGERTLMLRVAIGKSQSPERLRKLAAAGTAYTKSLDREALSARVSGFKRRLETLQDLGNQAAWAEGIRKCTEIAKQQIAAGLRPKPFANHRQTREQLQANARKGMETIRRKWADDPDAHAQWCKKISDGHGGLTVRTCVACGADFQNTSTTRKTCSRECSLKRRRALWEAQSPSNDPAVRAALVARRASHEAERDRLQAEGVLGRRRPHGHGRITSHNWKWRVQVPIGGQRTESACFDTYDEADEARKAMVAQRQAEMTDKERAAEAAVIRGIELRTITQARLRELYCDPGSGYPSLTELGRRFGVSYKLVRRILIEAGIKPRSLADQHRIDGICGRRHPPH